MTDSVRLLGGAQSAFWGRIRCMIFKTEPEGFKKQIEVVGCFVENSGEFLLLHRQPQKVNGGKWGKPAGKIDAGETPSQAMVRELFEETGMQIPESDLSYFDSIFVRHEGRDFVYHMFSTQLPDRPKVTLNPGEHQAFIWISPSQALEMDLLHDNNECIKLFYGNIQNN